MPLIRQRKGAHAAVQTAVIVLGLAFLLSWGLIPAAAQTGEQVSITQPDFDGFPNISFYLEAFNAGGDFVADLTVDDMQVLENGTPVAIESIRAIEPGMQVILAINTGAAMANRTGGVSGFQKIQAALLSWANSRPAEAPDDFTFITNDGPQTIREEDLQRLVRELDEYQPDLLHSQPSLSGLMQALDMAVDPNPRANMRRAILYITTLPADNQIQALENLIARAEKMKTRVFVWLAAPVTGSETKPAEALRTLAVRTGGEFFLFSGAETLPNPEAYFRPLREIYQVDYVSKITQSGRQSLAVEIEADELQAISNEQTFSITVRPPNPIFLNPPVEIRRMLSEPGAQPASVTLKILIEYPDGYNRPLKSARLYVDDLPVAERQEAPFDSFVWPLDGYNNSARHVLKVEVEDVLGLTQSSSETPVDVLVEQPRGSWLREQVSPQRLAIGGAVLLSGIGLVSALWVTGRRGWLSTDRRKRQRLFKDPVTQPVSIPQETTRRPTPAGQEHASWPRPGASAGKAPAWLVRVNELNQPVTGATVPLLRRELTFGSNPQLAGCVIASGTVDGLHARLWLAEGGFMLADAGSIAGTWVNFSPVSKSGTRLEHGDLVHFGQVAFRFEMANPPEPREPRVTRYEEPSL